MKKVLMCLSLILGMWAGTALFTGCSSSDMDDESDTVIADDEDDVVGSTSFSNQVVITFGSSVSVSNPLEDDGVEISLDGNYVTITSTAEEVEYVVTGTTVEGAVKIYSDYKFQLSLDDVSITNPYGPAINIQSHTRVFVELVDGTYNYIADGSNYTVSSDEDMKGAFFSEGQLIFSGTGTLEVEGNYKHAICSDDYVRIYEGEITVLGAVSDGIHTNDAVIIHDGTISITCSSDGIECEEGYILIEDGDITINSVDEGIVASYEESDTSIDPYISISGGTFQITTTGESAKGIKALGDLTINGGTFAVKTSGYESEGIESKQNLAINGGSFAVQAYDDCINAATDITITAGDIYCYSTTNDAIDSNGTLTISGGTIVAIGSEALEEGIDCDENTFTITGGTVIGIGSTTSTPTASVSTQPSLIYSANISQNTYLHIESADGDDVLTFLVPRSLQPMTLLFSSASLVSGDTYTIYTGGSVSGATDFYGLCSDATYSGGTEDVSFTISSMVTTVTGTGGSSVMPGDGGGGAMPDGGSVEPGGDGTMPDGGGTEPSGGGMMPDGDGTEPGGSGTMPDDGGTEPGVFL